MPKVTKITGQQKNAGRVSIFLDEKYAFSLTVDQLLDEKIREGQEIPLSDLDKFKQLSTDGKLYESVIRKLARRQHSQFEIEQFLKKKQANNDTVASIINKLHSMQYLNDKQFAEQWVEGRTQLKQRSKRALNAELRQKGIASEIIAEVLGDVNDDQALKDLLIKKRKQKQYQDENKLITYLQRKGFSYGDIKSTLNSIED